MKRKSVLMFLILFFSFISFIPFVYSDYVYVDNLYQINESKDDAVYYVGFNYYDDDDFLLLKSNLYDVKTGLVFNNISILDNATFYEVYLSVYSNDSYTDSEDYWVTIYGIDEDNVSSFADFEDFNNKSLTSNVINWNLEDVEGLDKWVNSSNLAYIFNEIRVRSGWSGDNNIGLMILATQSSDAYRMCISYDGNSTYAPKLYIKYKYYVPTDGVSEEEEFVKKYRGYDIYLKNVSDGCGWSYLFNYDYEVVEIFELGVNPFFYSNPFSETIIEAKNRYWIVTFDTSGDIWIYNSTNRINWYGTEIESIHEVEGSGQQYICGHYSLYSVKDSQGDIHIAYEEMGATIVWYIKIETFADGTINDLGTQSIGNYKRIFDLVVDGQDYPVVAVQVSANTVNLVGSTTKDGTWSEDYDITIGEGMQWIRVSIHPMSGDNGKDFVITYVWLDTYTFYGADVELYLIAQYFDESAESFNAQRWVVDYNLNGYPFSSYTDSPAWKDYNRGNAPTIAFEDNITFATYYGEDEATGKLALITYKTENGGLTWSRYNVHNLTAVQTDHVGHMIRINDNKDVIVYYRHNDINEGNCTFFYEAIKYEDVSGWSDWCCEDVEIYDTGICWNDRWEGAWSWSIVRGGETLGVIEKGLVFGMENNTEVKDYLHILDITSTEEEAGLHYFIYDEDGDLVASCFTDEDDAEEWIDEYIKEKQYDNLGNTISWMLGLLGLIMVPLGFVLFVSQAQSGDYRNAFLYLMICFFIGMSLFVGWLWG